MWGELGLTPPVIGAGTGWLLLVIGLVTGRLIPKWAHDERLNAIREVYQRQVDEIAHDRQEWRAESRIKDAVVSELQDSNRQLVNEVGGTVVEILNAVKKNQESA